MSQIRSATIHTRRQMAPSFNRGRFLTSLFGVVAVSVAMIAFLVWQRSSSSRLNLLPPKQPNGSYFIQVQALVSPSDPAYSSLVRRLIRLPVPGVTRLPMTRTSASGKPYYYILVGPYASLDTASRDLAHGRNPESSRLHRYSSARARN